MGIFQDIFGPHIRGPRSEEEPATDSLWPGDIRQALRSRLGFSDRDAHRIYSMIFNPDTGFVASAVREGKDVHITGLGKFTRRERSAGQVRNPATGGVIQVPARNHLAFKPSAKQRWEA